ncbi:MAG TPA: CPBP family intramembrane glutamic endopeptidase [Candidatus Sulfotelmatobacter sp.]|nr:CPBP family intramembrane glutamic endopeptidase [Candidatus Sulfotelmatobacter sp.]
MNESAGSAPEEAPPPGVPPAGDDPLNLESISLPTPSSAAPHRPATPDDLRVPWGWIDVLMFVVLGVVAGAIITWGLGWIAVRFFGLRASEVFGENMTTPKSIVALASQAVWDIGAMLFLYLLLVTKSSAPFWPSIGWREVRPGMRPIRDSALQFLAGGALLALVVTFVGGFLSTKETLPIEEMLKARVSILLFGIMGVALAPFVEETIFRGFLYPVIARSLGVAAGIGITGTLFGLLHAVQLWGGWGQIALLIMVGIVLTSVRARTGTAAASFFVHLGYNGLQLAGYLVYMIGRGHH